MHRTSTFGPFAVVSPRRSLAAAIIAILALGLAGPAARSDVIGFGGAVMTGWTPNASAAAAAQGLPNVTGSGTAADVLSLTNLNNDEAVSYWFNSPQSITSFTESFTYTNSSAGGADGIAVVWQNSGTHALGGGGGALGYAGITSAAALALNIYDGNSGSGAGFNNTVPSGAVSLTPTPGGVNLASGHPINVSLSYREADHALTETMTDTTSAANTFTRVWRGVSIQGQVGGTTALIGLTGGTGGINANQSVTNFVFTPGTAAVTPIASITPIAVTGFNQKMIVSNASGPSIVTATMDGGTNKDGDTFYENGVNTGSSAAGLPRAGVVFGSGNDANHAFVLEPNGSAANDAVLLDPAHTTGSLTLTTPARYAVLSFLVSGANGGGDIGVTINYAGGGTQTATIAGPDWFGNTPIAIDANGRVDVALDDFNADTSGDPRIYQGDLTLTDTAHNVTSISFNFVGTNRAAVFGLSGQPAPEPSTALALLCLLAGATLGRRHRHSIH